ncbi:MAG: hypothetical protein RL726_2210 [Actinomycetota bacterium]
MGAPLVLIVGRETSVAKGLRTPGYGCGRVYCDAVARAGGVPLILPPIADLVSRLDETLDGVDGVVLHGGVDIDPSRYGQRVTSDHVYGVDPDLDEVEFAVITAAIDRDLPVLAICRGFQVLNVAQGGTLIQHLEADNHRDVFHAVDTTPDSRVSRAMSASRPRACHSFHHQAIDRLGSNLTVTASSDDGIIEAVEHTDRRWVVGVQWHPEDSADVDAEQQGLFDEFVSQCVALRRGPDTAA